MTNLQIITSLINVIRGQRVILDSDLAKLYGVTTKRLNEACKRNPERFPEDFMFQLNNQEFARLRSQFATSNSRGGRTYLPNAFTEHGAIMAATLLRSPQAVEVSINVVRTFIELRKLALNFKELEKKLEEFKDECSDEFANVHETLRRLMMPPQEKKQKIGFIINKK